MIKLIGLKRATTIAAMLILNLLIVAALALVIEPMREEAEMRLNMSNAEIARLSSDTQNIKAELSAYDGNLARYEELKRRGFFMSQDRFEASRLLDDMRAKAELTGYNYKIEPIKAISNRVAAASYAELAVGDDRVEAGESPETSGGMHYLFAAGGSSRLRRGSQRRGLSPANRR